MKKIEAIIKPFKLDEVREALSDIGVSVAKDGSLSLDTSKLNKAVTADYASVSALVGKVGKLGVDGVPFFIIDRRLTVSGAQTGVVLAAAILQAMAPPA